MSVADIPIQLIEDALTVILTEEHPRPNYRHCKNIVIVAEHGYPCHPSAEVEDTLSTPWTCHAEEEYAGISYHVHNHNQCGRKNLGFEIGFCHCYASESPRGENQKPLRLYYRVGKETPKSCLYCTNGHGKVPPCPSCGQIH